MEIGGFNLTLILIFISWVYRFFYWALIGRALLSFMHADYDSPITKIYRALVQITEGIVSPCRELLYRLGVRTGPFDFSILVAFIALRIVYRLIATILLGGWGHLALL